MRRSTSCIVFLLVSISLACGGDPAGPSSARRLTGTWLLQPGTLVGGTVSCTFDGIRLDLDQSGRRLDGRFIATGPGLCSYQGLTYVGTISSGDLLDGEVLGDSVDFALDVDALHNTGRITSDSTLAGSLEWEINLSGTPIGQVTLLGHWTAVRYTPSSPGIPDSVAIIATASQLLQRDSLQLGVVVRDPLNQVIPGAVVTWSSSDTSRITVSPTGLIRTPGTRGTATITARSGTVQSTLLLTVLPKPTALVILQDTLTLHRGRRGNLSGFVVDASQALIGGIPITWTSSDPALASVSGGQVTADPFGIGTLIVRATGGGFQDSAVVNVVSIPTSLQVTPPAAIIPPGDSVAVSVLVLDSTQNLVPGATVAFQVSNPSLLSMTAGGYARSLGPTGNVIVTVTSGGLQAQLPFAIATVHVPAVVSTQPVGQRPYSIRIAPDGTAYISDIGDGSLYRGTAPSYQFVKIRTVGGLPLDLAINPAGTRLSVARDSLDRIEVIDLTADTVAGTIQTFPGAEPTALAYSPDGTRLYVGTGIDFRVYNAQTLALVDSIPGTGLINWITVHPTQPRVYVSTGSILEIDVGSMTVVRQFTGGQLQATVLSPTADTLYVTTEDGDTRAYDVSSGQLLATAMGGGRGMALSGDGSYLFTTDYNNHRLSVIFTSAMINVTVLDVGGGAARIAFVPGGTTALLPNTGGWVDVIQ